jgi:hypothetical protein
MKMGNMRWNKCWTQDSHYDVEARKVFDGAEWEEQYRELLATDACESTALWRYAGAFAAHRRIVVTTGSPGPDQSVEGLWSLKILRTILSLSASDSKAVKGIFWLCKIRIKDFRKDEALMIGDSQNTVSGVPSVRIDHLLINRKAKNSPGEIQSTYTITHLTNYMPMSKSGRCLRSAPARVMNNCGQLSQGPKMQSQPLPSWKHFFS